MIVPLDALVTISVSLYKQSDALLQMAQTLEALGDPDTTLKFVPALMGLNHEIANIEIVLKAILSENPSPSQPRSLS